MALSRNEVSRALSHALRHEPWLYELELDEEGWTSVDALVAALRGSRPDWAELSLSDVEAVVRHSDKRRHELSGDRIRALYGHSVPGKLKREPARPPAVLFHGTSAEAAEAILEVGLRAMTRQYVHLSLDTETAWQVGGRKSGVPNILQIDSARADTGGVIFYIGNDKVWLADFIPAEFVSRGA